ncbi:very short patch repair endonuclease [Nocardia nova]|uniref:very short patch repair endonuclease n=1 Tax=Nocardia nova TaxID=37330 RepID=UPI003712EDAD
MTTVPARAWKPRPGRSGRAVDSEQNRSAGGAHRRVVPLDDGRTAKGSIVLKPVASGRGVRAYLVWRSDGRAVSRSLGPVSSSSSRFENLIEGWELARAAGRVRDETQAAESWASSPSARAVMRANRGRDTSPELRLRALLFQRGLRYRVSVRPISGLRRTADIVFPRARVAVFVDGCYWHGCPEHYRPSTKNPEFWAAKIASNRLRDADTDRALSDAGWTVVRCWEHEDPKISAENVIDALHRSTP